MLNKILNLIETIPEEVKECFAIIISEKDGKKLLQEIYNKQHIFENYKKINSFPLSIMNIPIIIGFTIEPCLEPINNKDTLLKLYYYELYRFNNFMKEYEKLCNKYEYYIGGCGCCGSPYLDKTYTFTASEIRFENKKVKYDFMINYDELEDYLKKI